MFQKFQSFSGTISTTPPSVQVRLRWCFVSCFVLARLIVLIMPPFPANAEHASTQVWGGEQIVFEMEMANLELPIYMVCIFNLLDMVCVAA